MSYKVGLCGEANSGKSFSRRTIKDGENVFILQPSVKASHLKTSQGVPLKPFDLATSKVPNMATFKTNLNMSTSGEVINYLTLSIPEGTFQPEYIKGNVQLLRDVADLPIWIKFIDKHLPWIHTVILPDFTHYISEVISRPEFIERKAGGESYQKFWELAGEALRNFISDLDFYREDLIFVTEYHTGYNETLNRWELYTPAGQMLTGKFKPETYYDVFLFTDVTIIEDADGNVKSRNYEFLTERTNKYPHARAMGVFGTDRIPNDLEFVLTKVREHLGIPLLKK